MPYRLVEEEEEEVPAPQARYRIVEDKPSKVKRALQQTESAIPSALGTYGDILDLIGAQTEERMLPGQEALTRAEFEAPEWALPYLQDEDILPRYSRLPSSKEVSEYINEQEPQSGLERYIKRIFNLLGGGAALGAGPGALGTLAAAGGVGQSLREMGAPEIAADIAELGIGLGGGSIKNKVLPSSKQQKLVDYARKIGMSEEEITPLTKGKGFTQIVGKISKKTPGLKRTVTGIEEKLGDSYKSLKKEASSIGKLAGEESQQVIDSFGNVIKDLSTTVKAAPDKEAAIKFIQESIENIGNRGTSPEELINFYQDINSAVNWGAIKGGKKDLAALKKPIVDAIRKKSPELAEEFELTNELYSKFKNFSKAVKPDMVDKFIDLGNIGQIALGIGTLNPGLIKSAFTAEGAKYLFKELLTNPRLQGIHRKFLQSVTQKDPAKAKLALDELKKFAKEENPEIYKELESVK